MKINQDSKVFNSEKFKKYISESFTTENTTASIFPKIAKKPIIPIGTLCEIDGVKVRLAGRTGNNCVYHNTYNLTLKQNDNYLYYQWLDKQFEDIFKEKEKNDSIIQERYNELKSAITKEQIDTLVTVLPFNSGYFFTMKLPRTINAHEFRLKFLNEYKYGVYSMDDEHIRIAFSCLDKELIPKLITKFKECIQQF